MQFNGAPGAATLVNPVLHEHVTALFVESCPQLVLAPHIFGMAMHISEIVKQC